MCGNVIRGSPVREGRRPYGRASGLRRRLLWVSTSDVFRVMSRRATTGETVEPPGFTRQHFIFIDETWVRTNMARGYDCALSLVSALQQLVEKSKFHRITKQTNRGGGF